MTEEPMLRVESRFKNARLYNAIAAASVPLSDERRLVALQQAGPVKAFCEVHALQLDDVYQLLNLRLAPLVKNKEGRGYRRICLRLAALLEKDVAYLFPSEIYAQRWPRLAVELDHHQTVSLAAAVGSSVLELPAPQNDIIEQGELKAALTRALGSLTPREEKVLTHRFGLNGNDEKTLEEVGQLMDRSRERIRSIEAKALRKLRHSSRIRALKPFVLPPDETLPPTAAQIRRQQRRQQRAAAVKALQIAKKVLDEAEQSGARIGGPLNEVAKDA